MHWRLFSFEPHSVHRLTSKDKEWDRHLLNRCPNILLALCFLAVYDMLDLDIVLKDCAQPDHWLKKVNKLILRIKTLLSFCHLKVLTVIPIQQTVFNVGQLVTRL